MFENFHSRSFLLFLPRFFLRQHGDFHAFALTIIVDELYSLDFSYICFSTLLKMTAAEYLSEIQKQYATGVAREHTYRPALQNLLATMLPHLTVSNEPARQACGAPDYIFKRKEGNIPVTALNFYVGGHQPAQKWLKGRTTRTLSFDDILHYQRIIKALRMTDEIMETIDN
jgi:hypothetical protein